MKGAVTRSEHVLGQSDVSLRLLARVLERNLTCIMVARRGGRAGRAGRGEDGFRSVILVLKANGWSSNFLSLSKSSHRTFLLRSSSMGSSFHNRDNGKCTAFR